MGFIEDFASAQTQSLNRLKTSNDISTLRKELKITRNSQPDCAAESLYRTNKISIIESRIKELEDEMTPFQITQTRVATS